VLPHLSHVAYIFHISEKFALFLSVHFDSLTRQEKAVRVKRVGGGHLPLLEFPRRDLRTQEPPNGVQGMHINNQETRK